MQDGNPILVGFCKKLRMKGKYRFLTSLMIILASNYFIRFVETCEIEKELMDLERISYPLKKKENETSC